jgi:hypothetical protein
MRRRKDGTEGDDEEGVECALTASMHTTSAIFLPGGMGRFLRSSVKLDE